MSKLHEIVKPLHELIIQKTLTEPEIMLPWNAIIAKPIYAMVAVYHQWWLLTRKKTDPEEVMFLNESFLRLAVERDSFNPIIYLIDPEYLLDMYKDDKNKFVLMCSTLRGTVANIAVDRDQTYVKNRLYEDIMVREIEPRGEEAVQLFKALGERNLNNIEAVLEYIEENNLGTSGVGDMIEEVFVESCTY